MNIEIGLRIKKLRELRRLSQSGLSKQIGVRQPTLSDIENGKTLPSIETLIRLIDILQTTYDYVLNGVENAPTNAIAALKNEPQPITGAANWLGDNAYDRKQLLPVVVDRQNNPIVKLVPEFAQAGYLTERENESYWERLPEISLPEHKFHQGHYIGFQVWGESMKNTLQGGDWILCQYVDKISLIRPNEIYVLITRNDRPIVKRLRPTDSPKIFMCHSDNSDYQPFPISVDLLEEVWRYDTLIRFQPLTLLR